MMTVRFPTRKLGQPGAPRHWLPRSMAFLLVALVSACLENEPWSVGRSRLNLALITLDTTRADRIGAYGFADAGTPNIDRLPRNGVLFEQAESVAPLTLPAHCSLFTGRFPFASMKTA